jgi:hypothetical protein
MRAGAERKHNHHDLAKAPAAHHVIFAIADKASGNNADDCDHDEVQQQHGVIKRVKSHQLTVIVASAS